MRGQEGVNNWKSSLKTTERKKTAALLDRNVNPYGL